jgi:signal transduction histidine kinase
MEQVLMNLLINAMDATPRGGRITAISLVAGDTGSRGVPPRARITLMDTGSGIASGDLGNIFDPFFSTKETGTGLGLPLSLGIVEAHGGSLSVFSREGAGTTVILELPLDSETPEGRRQSEQEKDSDRR